mgnify:FL=1
MCQHFELILHHTFVRREWKTWERIERIYASAHILEGKKTLHFINAAKKNHNCRFLRTFWDFFLSAGCLKLTLIIANIHMLKIT